MTDGDWRVPRAPPFVSRLPRSVIAVGLAVMVSACAGTSPPVPMDPLARQAQSCRQLYRTLDARIEQAGVLDAQYARIAGFPYLRINRFLAADDIKPGADDDAFDIWVEQLRELDLDARRVELQNLPYDTGAAPGGGTAMPLEQCSRVMVDVELSSADSRVRLLESAWVPDDYSVSKRVIGLYPFTSLPFNAGVKNLHDSMRVVFSTPLTALPVEGRITRYRPPTSVGPDAGESLLRQLHNAERDRHGIARLPPSVIQQLFDAHAPVYEIDVVSDDDRIGTPFWSGESEPSVDVCCPVVFRRISHTRFEGRTLLQLTYSVWFPARPSSGAFDLLSGRLDGITFRVTLGDDGRPLIYDSMHNCGCYHLFVPTTRLRRNGSARRHEEPPFIAQQVEQRHGRVVLRIAHGSHYLQRLYFDQSADEGEIYAMRDDDDLRSLALANGGRRSLFASDGIVPGSERGERWLFWPMGIAEPGAMRQWGHHATAFVGTRHFDDPHLFERYFETVE